MPPEAGIFDSLVKAFGWPGAILIVVAIVAWRVWVKVAPILERMAAAWIARQQQASDSLKNLTEKTIEIQGANKESIEKLPDLIERLLRTKPPA